MRGAPKVKYTWREQSFIQTLCTQNCDCLHLLQVLSPNKPETEDSFESCSRLIWQPCSAVRGKKIKRQAVCQKPKGRQPPPPPAGGGQQQGQQAGQEQRAASALPSTDLPAPAVPSACLGPVPVASSQNSNTLPARARASQNNLFCAQEYHHAFKGTQLLSRMTSVKVE